MSLEQRDDAIAGSTPAQFDEQATAGRRKAAYEINKLSKRLHRQVGAAIIDFNMIEEGDKVMVCLSGGKDSYAMLDILLSLRERSPVKFDLVAVNLDQKQPGFPEHVLPDYLRAVRAIPVIQADFELVFAAADVLLAPGMPTTAELKAQIAQPRLQVGHWDSRVTEAAACSNYYVGKGSK